MIKKIKLNKIIFLLIYFLALIGFFIKTNISSFITLSDISFVLFVVFYFILNRKVKIARNVMVTTSLYFFYFTILASILIIVSTGLTYLSYLYIIKEMMYITTFFIVVKAYSCSDSMSKNITVILVLANIMYGFISIIRGDIAHYGIASIASKVPSQSGIIYITCMFISIILAISKKRKIYIWLSLLSAFMVTATISRTAILGLGVFTSVFLLLFISGIFNKKLGKKQINRVLVSFLLLGAIVLLVMKFDVYGFRSKYVDRTIQRFIIISGSIDTRKNMSRVYYNAIIGSSGIKFLFGQGKAIPEIYFNRTTLAVDNQFTRFVIEGGVIGLIMWIFMIFNWVRFLSKSMTKIYKYFLYSVVAAYFLMGFGYEVFQVSKSGISFWLVLGFLYSNTYNTGKNTTKSTVDNN